MANDGQKPWEAAKSIEAVQRELRNAVFFSQFGFTFQPPEQQNVMRQAGCGFVEFGVRAGLMTPDEGNEWLASIWEKPGHEALGMILLKAEIEKK